MTLSTDATKLRAASEIMDAYGIPASALVLRTVADAVEAGKRDKVDEVLCSTMRIAMCPVCKANHEIPLKARASKSSVIPTALEKK